MKKRKKEIEIILTFKIFYHKMLVPTSYANVIQYPVSIIFKSYKKINKNCSVHQRAIYKIKKIKYLSFILQQQMFLLK